MDHRIVDVKQAYNIIIIISQFLISFKIFVIMYNSIYYYKGTILNFVWLFRIIIIIM